MAMTGPSDIQHNLDVSQVDGLLKYALSGQYDACPQSGALNQDGASSSATSTLQGRKVFIPVPCISAKQGRRSQAFWIGELAPQMSTKDAVSATKSNEQEGDQEMVEIRGTSTTKKADTDAGEAIMEKQQQKRETRRLQVTVPEARAWLQRSNAPSSQAQTAKRSAKATAPQPSSSSSILRNKSASATSNNPPMDDSLPLFDIQEEFDASGQPVRASAINVTRQLEMMVKQHQQQKQRDDGEVKETESGAVGKPPAGDGEDVVRRASGAVLPSNDSKGADSNEAAGTQQSRQSKSMVSDEEFQLLSDRLEELARLEEEQEKGGKAVPFAISTSKQGGVKKRLQKKQASSGGGGWAKGFLNAKPKKTKKKIVPTKSVGAASAPEVKEAPNSKAVSFGTNEVKEIPRIGQTSISTIRKPQAQQNPPSAPTAALASSSDTAGPKQPNKALDSSIFSGVVQERPSSFGIAERPSSGIRERHPQKANRRRKQKQQQQQKKSGSRFASTSADAGTDQVQPKRLSRFAQERQGQI